MKYWTRQPYLGFGVDAHSMLPAHSQCAVRFSNPEALEDYLSGSKQNLTHVSTDAALQESLFLGLRLNRGVDWDALSEAFGTGAGPRYFESISELINENLIKREGARVRLTPRGRLLSNEVFERFIAIPAT